MHVRELYISRYSLPTCFDRCRGQNQGNLQHHKVFKQTIKMHKLTTNYYKVFLKLLTQSLNISLLAAVLKCDKIQFI